MKMIALCNTLLFCTLYWLSSCNTSSSADAEATPASDSIALVKQGEYLVNAIGCDDCHSPKQMGAQGPEVIADLRFSGYPSNRPVAKPNMSAIDGGFMVMNTDLTASWGPWGTSFSANITSDSTGIGNWTQAQFIKAIREGKTKGIEGNRAMLPPMPWFNFAKLSDDDLKAIYSYLQSTKPVHNVVPAPLPPAGSQPSARKA